MQKILPRNAPALKGMIPSIEYTENVLYVFFVVVCLIVQTNKFYIINANLF